MERRTLLFIATSLAIILASRALQVFLFPPRPAPARPPRVAAAPPEPGPDAAGAVIAAAPATAAAAGDGADARAADPETEAVREEPPAPEPRVRRTLGSLDPALPARMLVTITSRGAAVERIELADERFHDQDDRSGYLGHLAVEACPEGCRIGVVGPGTPAATAGLRSGDLITRVDGAVVADPRSLHEALLATHPGQVVAIDILREGRSQAVSVPLGRRPLEVVRPEFRGAPTIDADEVRHDPLSFRLSLESRDGRERDDPRAEVPGQGLVDVDWRLAEAAAGAVRFERTLPDGLTIAKEYRLAAGDATGYRLELAVELRGGDRESRLVYALDGPTGLPTEGWWYAQRVARDWGSLAARDVALRFVGEPCSTASGLKIATDALDHPASAVRAGKPLSFAGVDALYFASALIPNRDGPTAPALAEVRPILVGDAPVAARQKLANVTARLVSRELVVSAARPVVHAYTIFAGPKQPELLAGFGAPGADMGDIVYYGWFGWVARPLIALLHGLHALIGNYGIAILLLTVIVRASLFPLSRKQALSSQKMQALQPEMKLLAEKYKDDPEKRTRATQELWRKHKVNPVGGCLPVFIQIPIFMGLYRALATDVELRQAPLFSSAIRWCSNLAAPDMLFDWSRMVPAAIAAPEGWLGPFLNVFPFLTIALMLWQQKLFMPPAVDEQQKMQQQVMNFTMWFMAIAFFKVPCGLCLYFIASTLWGIAERLWLPPPQAVAAGTGEPRVVDAPFTPVSQAAANGAADAVRERRQSRKRQR